MRLTVAKRVRSNARVIIEIRIHDQNDIYCLILRCTSRVHLTHNSIIKSTISSLYVHVICNC